MHKDGQDQNQFYLRAEPTAESRKMLRTHQKYLAEVCEQLRLSPRFVAADRLHWTVIFLGSPERWTKTLRATGARTDVSADDLLTLAFGNDRRGIHALLAHVDTRPIAYDVFFNHGASAVFVLRLDVVRGLPTRTILERVREQLSTWERTGRIPKATVPKLFQHPSFPLARDVDGGKPHVTLARGRVSRERHRDVRRSIGSMRPVSFAPLSFTHSTIRTVGTPGGIAPYV